MTWYQSVTQSYFPDELHEHIAKTFSPQEQPSFQRKFCGFCGTPISYWTEDPVHQKDFINIALGSMGRKDILALEDLDLLPEHVNLEGPSKFGVDDTKAVAEGSSERSQVMVSTSDNGILRTSRSGMSGGISWFEDLIQGSQMGYHSQRRAAYGPSADGITTASLVVSEYYGDDNSKEAQQVPRSKRKAEDIEPEDTNMKE